MVRFLQTGDWQLGMNYKHVGEKGALLRQARLDALTRIIKLAREKSADFIIATGDQFEHNQVAPALVQQVVSILATADVPIYLIPGNHDPYNRQSVYKQNAWTQAKNVHILTEREPVRALPGVELFPCPLYENHGTDDPTSWIPRRKNLETIRIGIAHGSLLVRDDIDFTDSYPISGEAVAQHDLDYLAIGHWHSTRVYHDRRSAYSGTHDTTKFGEDDSGNVLLVEIDGPNLAPAIEKVHTGIYEWKQVKRTVRTETDYVALERELTAMSNPESILVDIALDGYVSPSLSQRITEDLRVLIAAQFFYGRFINEVKVAPSREDIENMSLSGVTKKVMERLLAEDSAISNQALSILFRELAKKDVIA